jgi:hypothetical protein
MEEDVEHLESAQQLADHHAGGPACLWAAACCRVFVKMALALTDDLESTGGHEAVVMGYAWIVLCGAACMALCVDDVSRHQGAIDTEYCITNRLVG